LAKYTGKGGEFQIQTVASPETWVSVGQIREIGSASITAEEIDVTTLDSNQSGTSTDYKDFLGGFKDPGEMGLVVLFDPNIASHGSLTNGLFELFDSGRTITARVKYPTSPVNYLEMQGFFRDWETPTINATDPIESTFTFRLRQKPQLTTS
jgi:hypothetical protein